MKQRMACLLIGILMGAVLLGGNVSQAAEAFLKAFPSTHTFYLDGQPIEMEAYSINGNNYVKLRDIGRMVGFNVYWDNGVQIDTSSPYTGTAPSAVSIGSYKGTVLDVGERSALIIPGGGTDYIVTSGNPDVLAVEQVSGYWVIEGVSPGTSQVQFTAPDGQQGDLAITVTKDGTLTNSASADLNENLELRQDILVLVNQVRQEHGLSAVPADQALMDAAQDYATRRNTWHDSQEECELALAHGYPYGFNCNLTVFTGASAEGAAKTAVENWVNSPGHLRTMLDSKADGLGVGVVRHEGVTYCYLFVGMSSTINPYA